MCNKVLVGGIRVRTPVCTLWLMLSNVKTCPAGSLPRTDTATSGGGSGDGSADSTSDQLRLLLRYRQQWRSASSS